MPIILCCGHEVDSFDDAVSLEFKDFVFDKSDIKRGGEIGTVTGLYCKKCAKRLKKELKAKVIGGKGK